MISVGGVESNKLFSIADPWANGIGVLDLPTLEWKTKYEANPDDYDSPQFIKDWYQKGYVRSWFRFIVSVPLWRHVADLNIVDLKRSIGAAE